ncbi:hypothetical protein BD309DRAFT_955635 [Dichomitus squalens]|nr:hypothetical protein BD309DRAFT_955635 [Dichomitus squalens]
MGCHEALNNGDVVYLVISCLTPEIEDRAPQWKQERRERNKALARFACVCKSFRLPALQMLWRRLESMLPLLRLFSALRHVEAEDGDNEVDLHVLSGEILPHEWERFLVYAQYVRTVDSASRPVGFAAQTRIAPSVWSHMGRLACGNPLLPNLQELGWVVPSPQCTGILPFLSPTIAQLNIVCFGIDGDAAADIEHEWNVALQAILPTVFSVACQITRLTMTTGQIDYFTPHLASLRFLRYFRATRVNIRTLRILAALEDLQELHVGNFDTADEAVISFSGFLRLRTLIISEHPSSSSVYNAFSSQELTKLYVLEYPGEYRHALPETCEIWAHRFPSLQVLCFYISRHSGDDASQVRPLRDAITPLFALSDLRTVGLATWHTMFSIDDSDMAACSQAWHRLEALRLSFPFGTSDARMDSNTCPTPSSLLAFAKKCPELKELRIRRLKVNRDNLLDLNTLTSHWSHGLRYLDVEHVDADNNVVPDLARWIVRLFPHLVPQVRNPDQSWKRVLDAVRKCQSGDI